MPPKKIDLETDKNTEQKIKDAARDIFHKKGFAATRTRDIAELSGINLALINYYFRSKQKLFDIIMLESMQSFFKNISDVFNDPNTSFENKIDLLVGSYIDLLSENPQIPLFILNELKNNPGDLLRKFGMKKIVMDSYFLIQLSTEIEAGKVNAINPLHLIMNLLGMTVFPFISSPIVKGLGDLSAADFNNLMQERRVLIPKWIKQQLLNF